MKRAVPFALAIVLVCCMALPAAAATTPKVYYITEYAFSDYEGNAAVDPEKTTPDDEIIIPLLRDGFEDENGALITWSEQDPTLGPSVGQAKSNFKVSFQMEKGKGVIRDIDIVKYTPTKRVRAQSAIRIRFVEDFISTEELEYRFTVYLSLKSNPSIRIQEIFGGMLSNPLDDSDGYELSLLEKGYIAYDAFESKDDVILDLGGGVTIQVDLIKGEKYYGLAKLEPNEGQDAILEAYPQIMGVYLLSTINIKSFGNDVRFYDLGELYYVYNELGEYIGMSDVALPYSTRYYLSPDPVKINIDVVLPQEEEDDWPMDAALSRFMRQGQSE